MVRIQLRRDTAANWTSSNPVLRAGELGIETDTLKFKVGNGTSTWTQITAYANVTSDSLTSSLSDYIESADLGQPSGPAQLTETGDLLVPGDEIVMVSSEDSLYTTTLAAVTPTAFRTINFPNSSGTVALTSQLPTQYTDELAQDAVATALAAGTHTNITVTYNDSSNSISLTGSQTYSDENAQDAVGNAVGTGLSYNDSTGAIGINYVTVGDTLLDGVSGSSYGLIGTSAYLDVKNTNGYNKEIELDITAVESQLVTDGFAKLNSATFTGTVTLAADPSSALHAATKQYVDNTASGIVAKPQVLGATTLNIDATYNNGTAGVGATLTHNTNGVFPATAGGAEGWAVGKGILVKNQTNKAQNGRYYISDMGSSSTPYVLTRCGYCDEASEIPGAYIFVQDGTNAGTGWVQTVADATTFTVGTDDITIVQFSGSGTITAGTGITVNGNEVSINTATTADLSTAQTLTNKTLTSPNINEAVALTATSTELNTLDGITASTAELNTLDGITASTAELNILDGVTSSSSELNILDGATLSTTELNYVDGVTSAIQTQLDGKVDESIITAKGDLYVGSASATLDNLAVGTNGYLLTADSNEALGVKWAAAPVSLPSQTGENGKYLTTDGTNASWGTLVVPISTGTVTVNQNTAQDVDTTALSTFTSIEYMVSISQGSKVRTSKVIMQTGGEAVDMTEFAITETGGTISGVVVAATTASSNAKLQVTVTDALSTNATVKFSKVAL